MSLADNRMARRGAALAILAVIVAIPLIVLGLVIGAFVDSVRADAIDARQQIDAYNVIVAHRAVTEANLLRIRETFGTLPYLLKGTTPAVSTAALQDEMKAILADNSGVIVSAEALPSDRLGNLQRVGIRYSVNLPASELPKFLSALESHIPYLFAGTLKISASDGSSDSALTLDFDVSGYCRSA